MEMTDKQLLNLCQKYGGKARRWKRKFAALLPEVNRRKLWKKKFHSIHEFAAQVGGVSGGVVDKVLFLDKKLEEKPLLKAEIEKQGWTKVEVAARLPVEEEEAVKMIQTLPKSTLETYAKEVVGLGEALEELLNQVEELPTKGGSSRIPAKQKQELRKEHNGRCPVGKCKNPSTEFHHTKRFAKDRTHEGLVLICKHHHQMAHAGLIENEHDPPEEWRPRKKMQPNSIDRKYLKQLSLIGEP